MLNVSVMTGNSSGTIPVDMAFFPCGERKVTIGQLKMPSEYLYEQVSVNLKYESDQDLIDLLLLVDAIERCPWLNYKNLVLMVGYLPYGRQDRVCNAGEAHSLKVICGLINQCGFDRIFLIDPHSDVPEALLDNVTILDLQYIVFASNGGPFTDCDAFVSPDGGAYKKVTKAAQVHGTPIIRADKTRDVKTGALSGFEVYADDLTGQSVLILDDICDGGGTFIGLAQKLREKGAKEVILYVTHGMFTKGTKALSEHIDEIWCYEYHGSPEGYKDVFEIDLFKE